MTTPNPNPNKPQSEGRGLGGGPSPWEDSPDAEPEAAENLGWIPTIMSELVDEKDLANVLELVTLMEEHFPITPESESESESESATKEPSGVTGEGEGEGIPRRIGRFAIRSVLGEGGLGVVFLAFDPQLLRWVALKIPRHEIAFTHNIRMRFLREAKAAAQLDHPGLLPVLEAGEVENICYIAYPYCPGPTLGQWLAANDNRALAPRDAARVMVRVARAVAHAHNRGIIHRDLKPSNIMLQPPQDVAERDCGGAGFRFLPIRDYEPKVTDFGLARVEWENEERTRTGMLVGSMPYMSPEQLSGDPQRITHRIDIHALGALTYVLLTGQLPYTYPESIGLMVQIQTMDPVPPSRRQPGVPRDLETVCLKCLEKDPQERYDTADDLADDLECFLEGRPIRARRASVREITWRWCLRHKAVATLLCALFLSILIGFAGILANWRESVRQRGEALAAQSASQRLLARNLWDQGMTRARQGQVALGLVGIRNAFDNLPQSRDDNDSVNDSENPPSGAADGNPSAASLERVIRTGLTSWSRHLHQLDNIFKVPENCVKGFLIPGDRLLVLLRADSYTLKEYMYILDMNTGNVFGPAPLRQYRNYCELQYLAANREIIVGGDGALVEFFRPDVATLSIMPTRTFEKAGFRWFGIAPEGAWIMPYPETPENNASITLDILDAAHPEGPPVLRVPNWSKHHHAIVSPDRRRLVGYQYSNRFPDKFLTFRELPALAPGPGTNGNANANGNEVAGPVIRLPFDRSVQSIQFHPQGRLLAVLSQENRLDLIDPAKGRYHHIMKRPFLDTVTAFLPDGSALGVMDDRGTPRFWDLSRWAPLSDGIGHANMSHIFLPFQDGRRMVSVYVDGSVLVWRLAPNALDVLPRSGDEEMDVNAEETPSRNQGLWKSARYAPAQTQGDPPAVLIARNQPLARLANIRDGAPVGAPIVTRYPQIAAAAVDPTGRYLCMSSLDYQRSTNQTLQFWDARTGAPVGAHMPHPNWVTSIAFHPSGQWVAAGDYAGEVRFWTVPEGAPAAPTWFISEIVMDMDIHPEGRYLAVGNAKDRTQTPALRIWDVARQREACPPHVFDDSVIRVRFRNDGKTVAATSLKTLSLFETSGWTPVCPPISHKSTIQNIVFDETNRYLIVLENSGDVWVRDAATGRRLLGPLEHGSSAIQAQMDPFGKLLAVGASQGEVQLWDVESGLKLGAPFAHRQEVIGLRFSSDGRMLNTFGAGGAARQFPTPIPSNDADMQTLSQTLRRNYGVTAAKNPNPNSAKTPARLRQDSWNDVSHPPAVAEDRETSLRFHFNRATEFAATRTRWDNASSLWHWNRLQTETAAADLGIAPAHPRFQAAVRMLLQENPDVEAARSRWLTARELGPEETVLNWTLQEARELILLDRKDRALDLLRFAASQQPTDWRISAAMGDCRHPEDPTQRDRDWANALTQGGEKNQDFLIRLADVALEEHNHAHAASLLNHAEDLGAVPFDLWDAHARLCLEQLNDPQAYAAVCAKMHRRFRDPRLSLTSARILAKVCAWHPLGVGLEGVPIRWIEQAFWHGPQRWRNNQWTDFLSDWLRLRIAHAKLTLATYVSRTVFPKKPQARSASE